MGRTSDDLGLYVHLPFCERVCPYCDFAVEAVGRLPAALEKSYVETALAELRLLRERHASQLHGRRLATVYVGGGTPSLLSAESVARLIHEIRASFVGAPGEVTLELNPGIAENRRVDELRAAGVTRVSVGVQSLDDDVLRALGRGHSAADARAGLEACLAGGFASLSADLIYGAPRQSEETLLRDLGELVRAGVPHVSAYALTIEPGTPFGVAHAAGRLALPDEETARRMGRRVRAELAAAGCAQYEISSFARPGHESRHNSRYWLREDVVALGPSGATLLREQRFQNRRSRAEWAACIARGEPAHEGVEVLDDAEQRRETLALGFRRLEGVSRSAYRRRFGTLPERAFRAEMAELEALELIQLRADCWRLTERGILFADEVFLRFAGR
jgi:oxygen-independent coproporphyrinogen III oxidase